MFYERSIIPIVLGFTQKVGKNINLVLRETSLDYKGR